MHDGLAAARGVAGLLTTQQAGARREPLQRRVRQRLAAHVMRAAARRDVQRSGGVAWDGEHQGLGLRVLGLFLETLH